jgi:transposase
MRLPALEVPEEDRAVLERTARSKTAAQRDVTRAQIILRAAAGESNVTIADAVGIDKHQVSMWRSRYGAQGLQGLEDCARPGRPLIYGHDDRLRILKTICDEPPAPASRWTMDALSKALADEVGISASQIWRICVGLDLKPWQVRSWMTSHDPDFWVKAADICGLYLDPPDNAVVYSIDEKSGMQAKSRKNPTKPAVPGTPTRREFEYKRHGTAVLYAALEVHDGGIDGWVADSTRSDNFVAFLADIVSETPLGLELHCICDNLSAHSTSAVEDFLDDHPHVFLHNTPTHASWLNQVELFLSILSRRLLRHGEFSSVDDMTEKILAFIDHYNTTAKPFRWTYDGRPLQVA